MATIYLCLSVSLSRLCLCLSLCLSQQLRKHAAARVSCIPLDYASLFCLCQLPHLFLVVGPFFSMVVPSLLVTYADPSPRLSLVQSVEGSGLSHYLLSVILCAQ